MAWLYVPESVDSSLESRELCPDTEPSVTWKGKPMQRRSLSRAWKTAPWIRRLSGMTLPPSTAQHGVASWMSSLQDTRASRSPLLESAEEREREIPDMCGRTLPGSSTSASLDLSYSRTCPDTLPSDSTSSGPTFEEWVSSLRRPPSTPRKRSALHTSEDGSFSLLPTPTAGDAKASGAAGYSTASGRHSDTTLTDALVRGYLLPTLSAQSYGTNKGGAAGRVGKKRPSLETMGREAGAGYRLNPAFTEWLMGWPSGWTDIDCAPAVMGSCPSKQQPRSVEDLKSCEKGSKDMETGRAKPILKWAGGKSWFVREFGQDMRTHLEESGGRYLEPFLGGGAMALYLGRGSAMLGDLDEELINVYIAVRHMPGAVHGVLEDLAQFGTDEKSYRAVRDSESDDMVESAARTIYLNKLCFNGLYRKNKKGIFNVPYGGHAKMPSLEMLLNAAAALAGARLFAADFETIIQEARENDTIYGDPPYYGTYSGYSSEGFGGDDHERLAEALYHAQERGASFFLHNTDTEHVRWLYEDWADIVPMEERRSISADGAARGEKAPCLLICSREIGEQ